LAQELGLVDAAAWGRVLAKEAQIAELQRRLNALRDGGRSFAQLLARPGMTLEALAAADSRLQLGGFSAAACQQVEIEIRYAGYLSRQAAMVERLARGESQRLPDAMEYAAVSGLRNESRTKLTAIRPATLGQAGRIPGITPADIAVLMVHLKRHG
jgi:tRNA uridine 5-carboxymethylaminomethyl modification enzyme